MQNQPSGPQVGKLADSAPLLCIGGAPPTAERGCRISQVAHKWANWLILHPCSVSVEPHRCRAGVQNQPIGPQEGKLADSAPPLCIGGAPPTAERGCRISQVALKWANWLTLHPCSVSVGPHRCTAGVQNQPSGPQVGKLADSAPLLCIGGAPTAAERGCKISQVAHKWANWLILHPCSVSVEPHRLQSGGAESAKWPTSGQIG